MSENPRNTILVVEDDDEIGSYMNALLKGKGYKVLRAKDADDAIIAAEGDRPGLILTDLDLPTLGPMLQRLKAHDTLKNTVVAVIDIDHDLKVTDGLRILNNFDEMDQLIASAPES